MGVGEAAVEGMLAIGKAVVIIFFWIGVGIFKYFTRQKNVWANNAEGAPLPADSFDYVPTPGEAIRSKHREPKDPTRDILGRPIKKARRKSVSKRSKTTV